MARILAISSQVARGHVGLSAIVPGLQMLGHEVIALPTVLLSAHPGHGTIAGERVAPALLARMIDALRTTASLAGIDAVLSGYLPTAEHVDLVAGLIGELKAQRDIPYMCDPVLGDHPKGLYIDRAAAEALRDRLLPRADVVTPNLFELTWLGAGDGAALPSRQTEVRALAELIQRPAVLVTSAPAEAPDMIANMLVFRRLEPFFAEPGVLIALVPRLAGAPHGTGDLLAGLLLGHLLHGRGASGSLGRAIAGLDAVARASAGELDLRLFPDAERWSGPRPWPVANLQSDED